MARLLAHLAGPPHHGSPLIFPSCSNSCAFLKSIDVAECGLHPSLEGKGQMNLNVEGPKKREIV